MAQNITLKQFSKNLEHLNKKGMNDISEIILREMTLRFLSKVIQLTPVGQSKYVRRRLKGENGQYLRYTRGKNKGRIKTKRTNVYTGGTLRRGWIVKQNISSRIFRRKLQITNKFKPTQAEIEDFVKKLKFKKVGNIYKITVVNPVEYAKYVNYGHRKRRKKGYYGKGPTVIKSTDWVQGYFFLEKAEKYINNPANYNKVFKELYERELKRRIQI